MNFANWYLRAQAMNTSKCDADLMAVVWVKRFIVSLRNPFGYA